MKVHEMNNREMFSVVRDLLLEGSPVRVSVKGQSMLPFFRSGSPVSLRRYRSQFRDSSHHSARRRYGYPARRREYLWHGIDDARQGLRNHRLLAGAYLLRPNMAVAPPRPPLPARDYPAGNPEIKQVANDLNDFKVIKDFKDFKEIKKRCTFVQRFFIGRCPIMPPKRNACKQQS